MQEKIKSYLTRERLLDIADRFRDVRFTGLMLFLLVVLLISWSGVKTIEANYQLQKQISTLKQEIAVQQLENNNLKLQNAYLESDQYLELTARQNLALGAAGETEVIIPKNVALAHTVTIPKQPTPQEVVKQTQPAYQRNLQAWLNFFLGRGTD